MAEDRPTCVTHVIHALVPARDWQDRPEFAQVCAWWRGGGNGVLALVGNDGAGKTAVADRFVRSLPSMTEDAQHLLQDATLSLPDGLFVFSFDHASNPEHFFDALYDWLVTEFRVADRRRVTDSGGRIQAPVSLVVEALRRTPRKLLLIVDGLETVQGDGGHSGVLGHIAHGGLWTFLQHTAAGLLTGLGVLVTTRYPLDDLEYARGRGTAPLFESVPIAAISDTACIALLRRRSVRGGDAALREIGRACGRHALTVDLAAGYLGYFHDGDPTAPLHLPTPEELHRMATPESDHRPRPVAEQTLRFRRIVESYHVALAQSDPAALALLQRLCLFRLGTDAATLTRIFTGPGRQTVSGYALAALSPAELQAKLNLLADLRLIIPARRSMVYPSESGPSTLYSVHPAVRDGFLSGFDVKAARCGHEAISQGLPALLGDRWGTNPYTPTTLDLLEEIVYHTLQAGPVDNAWDIYCQQIGGYWNLGWRLGAYQRGERICRAFANGFSPQAALGGEASFLPFRKLSEHWQTIFLNEWALYLKQLGRLDGAARCFTAAKDLEYRHEKWANASTGSQNLAEICLVAGHLTAGVQATTEALRLAERADDAVERMAAYAYRGQVRVQQGDTENALTDFHSALYWQRQAERQSTLPLYSLRGVYHTLLLARLGHYAEATRLTERNKAILLRHGGPPDDDVAKCHLILADLACQRGDWLLAHTLCHQAHAWALERDAKEVLCWSALQQARIELEEVAAVIQPPSGQAVLLRANEHVVACHSALADGLGIARECGYSIYHIDLLLVQAQLALLVGDPDAALADVQTVLTADHPAAPGQARPSLLAATTPACGYAWGEAEARHLRAEALLLQAAQHLGRPHYAPTYFEQLPADLRQLIGTAHEELTRCQTLRQRIQDPKIRQTANTLNRLNEGELTRFMGWTPPPTDHGDIYRTPVDSTQTAKRLDIMRRESSVKMPQKRFRVALAFPGEYRQFAAEVATFLVQNMGKDRVFYDKHFEAELEHSDLDTYLQRLYHGESELLVVFLCAEYERKEWCGLKWRAMRDVLQRKPTLAMMPMRFDDTQVLGLFSNDEYINLTNHTPAEAATLILRRLAILDAGNHPQ